MEKKRKSWQEYLEWRKKYLKDKARDEIYEILKNKPDAEALNYINLQYREMMAQRKKAEEEARKQMQKWLP